MTTTDTAAVLGVDGNGEALGERRRRRQRRQPDQLAAAVVRCAEVVRRHDEDAESGETHGVDESREPSGRDSWNAHVRALPGQLEGSIPRELAEQSSDHNEDDQHGDQPRVPLQHAEPPR